MMIAVAEIIQELDHIIWEAESGLSYGFCFSSNEVDESVMESIVSSFRLKRAIGQVPQ